VEKVVYSKQFIDLKTLIKNLQRKEIELLPKANELNGGILGKHQLSSNRFFSVEEHIHSCANHTMPLNSFISRSSSDSFSFPTEEAKESKKSLNEFLFTPLSA